MKRLDRYILKEMFVPFCIGQAAIVFMLVGTILYNNANVLLLNQVPVAFVFRMVLFFLPFLLHMTMPVAMAVGASLAVSRLGRDSEITVLRASGVSLRRIFLPIYLLGLAVSVGDFYFGEYVVPPSIRRLQGVFAELPQHLKRLVPQSGQYFFSNDQSYAFFITQLTLQKGYIELKDVQIIASPKAVETGETQPFVVFAKKGRYEGGNWTLYEPSLIKYDLSGNSQLALKPEKKTQFKLFTVVDPQAFQSGFALQFPMWQMGQNSATRSFRELGEAVKRNREQGIKDYFTLMDYHFKLSVPFSCFVMALCCPPLANRFAGQGGFMGTLLSIFLVFLYWNTVLLMRILGSPGAEGSPPLVSPILAAWLQNILFAIAGIWTLRRSE